MTGGIIVNKQWEPLTVHTHEDGKNVVHQYGPTPKGNTNCQNYAARMYMGMMLSESGGEGEGDMCRHNATVALLLRGVNGLQWSPDGLVPDNKEFSFCDRCAKFWKGESGQSLGGWLR